MSADDLSASGRWARDPYVQALEEQLKKLGFKEDELKQLKKDAKGSGKKMPRGLASFGVVRFTINYYKYGYEYDDFTNQVFIIKPS